MEWNIRMLDRRQLTGFGSYLLPFTAAALEREDENIIAIGAVSGRNALGAAAIRFDRDGQVVLTDLFVDALVRRQGIGTGLLNVLLDDLTALGFGFITADYALGGEDLIAMDALLVKCGFTKPQLKARNFCAPAGLYHQVPIISQAFHPRYRTPESVVSFAQLPKQALDELEKAQDIPYVLSWAHLKPRALSDLSVAFMQDEKVAAYQLVEESADNGFVLLSAFSREKAPPSAFIILLLELLNRCWYRVGGDYPFYFSAASEYVERLARRLMGERCIEYEEHICLRHMSDQEDRENLDNCVD